MYPTAAITPIAHSVPQPPPLLQQQQREGEGAATSPGRQPRPLTSPLHLQDPRLGLASGNRSAWGPDRPGFKPRRSPWVLGGATDSSSLSLSLLLRKVGMGLVPTQ